MSRAAGHTEFVCDKTAAVACKLEDDASVADLDPEELNLPATMMHQEVSREFDFAQCHWITLDLILQRYNHARIYMLDCRESRKHVGEKCTFCARSCRNFEIAIKYLFLMESIGEQNHCITDEDACYHNDMIYTISTIQHLGLRFTVDALNSQNAKILVEAVRILQNAVSSQVYSYETLCTRVHVVPSAADIHNMLCTWRPAYCADIFLFFGPQNMIVVGLPMLSNKATNEPSLLSGLAWTRHSKHPANIGESGSRIIADNDISIENHALCCALANQTTFSIEEWAEFRIQQIRVGDYVVAGSNWYTPNSDHSKASDVEIKLFSPEVNAAVVDFPECVCFAHLTCDRDGEDNHSMVALVYDVLLKDQDVLDTRQRYEFLRSISDPLSRIVIGDTCVRVQWAGDPCMFHQLQTLALPHVHYNIVLYGNERRYNRYAFEHPPTT